MGFRSAVALGVLLSTCAAALFAASAQAAPIGAFTTKGAYTYFSAPRLHPPKIKTDEPTNAGKLASGFFMVANFKNLAAATPIVGQGGPLVLNSKLQPVWFDPVPTSVYSLNLHQQTYQGKPVLSWWEGVISAVGAVSSGKEVVVNQDYRQIATLQGSDGWVLSPHEFVIDGSDAWVTANKTIPMDLTQYGGLADGVLTDSAVQEYDLKNGKLLRTWDALQHIPLSESEVHAPAVPGIPWDAYHINAINLTGNGSFITSMRNTWAAYQVDSADNIDWTLGGNASSFTFGPNATFHWQHDVEMHSGNEVSLFDDDCCGVVGPGVFAPPEGPSRGLVLKLDTAAHTATFVAQYNADHVGLETSTQGDTQVLSDGNVLVGWGGQSWFTEYSKSGKVLLDALLPAPNISYRAYVQKWAGTPFFPPSGAARKSKGKTTVYASWDGATKVVAWAVLAGPNAAHLTSVATKSKNNFETSIRLKTSYKVYKLRALDSKGHVLRTSKAFSVPKTKSLPLPPPGSY